MAVQQIGTCPWCGTDGPVVEDVEQCGAVYYVHLHYPTCGHTVEDTEGGV